MKMSVSDWNLLVTQKDMIEDLSAEMPDAFLMWGQTMKAKIRWHGKVFFATGWAPPSGKPYVELVEQSA